MAAKTKAHESGILTLDFYGVAEKTFNISTIIAKQVLLLQTIRVQMVSVEETIGHGILYLDLPFFNSGLLVDDNPGRIYLPLFLGSDLVTYQSTLQLPVNARIDIPDTFTGRVLNDDFTLIDPEVVKRVSVQFTFNGALTND